MWNAQSGGFVIWFKHFKLQNFKLAYSWPCFLRKEPRRLIMDSSKVVRCDSLWCFTYQSWQCNCHDFQWSRSPRPCVTTVTAAWFFPPCSWCSWPLTATSWPFVGTSWPLDGTSWCLWLRSRGDVPASVISINLEFCGNFPGDSLSRKHVAALARLPACFGTPNLEPASFSDCFYLVL